MSFYETVIKQPQLAAHVPPVLHYARDGGGDIELFAIPVTIANDGAKTGTVLSMTLEAVNTRTKVRQRFYSAYLGDHPKSADETPRAFAPLSIPGRATFSDTIRFYPAGPVRPFVLDDAGEVEFTLTLDTVKPPAGDMLARIFRTEPTAVRFTRTLPAFSEQQLGMRRLAIAMKESGWLAPLPAVDQEAKK